MATVQFYGISQVMAAARNRRCSCWGIYIARQLFSKFEDTDLEVSMNILEDNLEVLQESGTTGIYTLKFFECDGNKPVKIKENTVCDGGAFNFKLIEPEERESNRVGYTNNTRLLEQRIAGLEKQLLEASEPEEPQTIGAVLLDLVKQPSELAQLVNVGRMLCGLPVQQMQGAIGAVRAGAEVINQEEIGTRVANAIDELEKHDPNLLSHLEKLVKMAKENPQQFKGTLSILDLK